MYHKCAVYYNPNFYKIHQYIYRTMRGREIGQNNHLWAERLWIIDIICSPSVFLKFPNCYNEHVSLYNKKKLHTSH